MKTAKHHQIFPARAVERSRSRAALTPRLARAALTLCLVALLAACHRAAPVAAAPREVVVLSAQAVTQGAGVSLPAQVEARFVTPLSFRIAGLVQERLVHLGDSVRQGQIVARLDPADQQRNAASAQADLAAARERLATAQQQSQRDTAQAHENLISALQLEQTQDALAAAQSQAKDAEQRAGLAANQLGYTNLLAEHDGVISAEQANTGEVLSAGQAVFSLAWSGATDVTTELAESQVGAMHLGAAARITLAALPGHVLHGTLREISPAADPQSRTFHAKITLDTPDPALRLGMTGEVAIDTAATPAARQTKTAAESAANSATTPAANLMIPATALFHQGDQPAVWIVRADGKLELRPVTVAAYGERSVTLASGVAAGDQIVVQGVHTLTAGETVKPIAPLHPEDFAL